LGIGKGDPMTKPMKGVTKITRKGVDYWYAQVDGRRVYCGKDDKGRKLAEAARSKYVAKQYESREIHAGLKVKKTRLRTVKELMNWYMELPSVQQLASYSRMVIACTHLMAFFGNRPVSQVEGDVQEKYRERRKRQGIQDGTIDLEITYLSVMYHAALKRKKISQEALPGEFVKARIKNPRRIITDQEFEAILDYADMDFQDFLICGYETAMRLREITNLVAGQVHLNTQHISGAIVDYIDLGIFDTKTGARRTIPVSERLKEILERRLQGLDSDDYVFTDSGSKIRGQSVPYRLRLVCKDAEVPYGDKLLDSKGAKAGVVFHCLRHTRTSKWIEMGFSDEIVRRATGHKSLEAYQQYVKLDPSVVMRLVKPKVHKNGIKTAESLGN